jgi:hypothetical protein
MLKILRNSKSFKENKTLKPGSKKVRVRVGVQG